MCAKPACTGTSATSTLSHCQTHPAGPSLEWLEFREPAPALLLWLSPVLWGLGVEGQAPGPDAQLLRKKQENAGGQRERGAELCQRAGPLLPEKGGPATWGSSAEAALAPALMALEGGYAEVTVSGHL